jgi:hypothetical protein
MKINYMSFCEKPLVLIENQKSKLYSKILMKVFDSLIEYFKLIFWSLDHHRKNRRVALARVGSLIWLDRRVLEKLVQNSTGPSNFSIFIDFFASHRFSHA